MISSLDLLVSGLLLFFSSIEDGILVLYSSCYNNDEEIVFSLFICLYKCSLPECFMKI